MAHKTKANEPDLVSDPKIPQIDGGAVEPGSGFVPVEPFEIVVFGGTGDLARRKLIPSLYHRFCDGQISSTSKIIATSRSDLNRDQYLTMIKDAYQGFNPDETLSEEKISLNVYKQQSQRLIPLANSATHEPRCRA